MIFILRLVIFSILIIGGFAVAVRSATGRKIVTVIYAFALLYYIFLCRLPLFTTTPVAADSLPSAPMEKVSPSLAEQIWNLIKLIFGSQPDGTLAGGGIFRAMVFNALLFVPLGYLLLLWYPRLQKNWKGRIVAVLITVAVSILIECVQSITGLGMADWKDVLGNSLGGGVGVLMVLFFTQGDSQTLLRKRKDNHKEPL